MIILRPYGPARIVREKGTVPWWNPEQLPCPVRVLSGTAPKALERRARNRYLGSLHSVPLL